MKPIDTPRTDAVQFRKQPISISIEDEMLRALMLRALCHQIEQLERELAHSLENQVKAQAEVKEIRAALGDDGRRTHKEILELATKASQWREWKKKYIDLKNAHMAEGQDPAGTIWEHADKLQKELNASKAEVKIFHKEIIFREAMDNVAQEVWDEMKAKVERLSKLTEDCLNVIRVCCPTYYQDAMERFNKTDK